MGFIESVREGCQTKKGENDVTAAASKGDNDDGTIASK